jgi:uncharacterized membrane protein
MPTDGAPPPEPAGAGTAAGPHLDCAACRTIDRQDGAEDGRFYATPTTHVRHERVLVQRLQRTQDRIADVITSFAGSLRFVYLHTIWFGLWIVANLGVVLGLHRFDPYPFGLLTMIVSLEAIFLSTFVMVSQNRQSARADVRSEIDFENNLRAEIWSVHIGQALGIDPDHVEGVVRKAMAGYRAQASLGPPAGT